MINRISCTGHGTCGFGMLILMSMASAPAMGQLTVTSVEPAARSLTAPVGSAVVVHFDRTVNPTTVTDGSFWAFGRWSGTATGAITLTDGDATIVLTLDEPFFAGEQVMVILSHDIEAADGSPLRAAGYSFQFWTRASPADMNFSLNDTLTTQTGGVQSRAYGGIASDVNNDGYSDITIVNEVSADLRVFLNRADGSGLLHDFIKPTFPVNIRASPSEPADFNHDGIVDICVANIDTATVSILLGNGDGTFAPQQEVSVGSDPRGIAVLDVDGDGDVDIVNTNFSSNNMSVLINNGSGVFGSATFFEGGGTGEWALAAVDMNEDGLLDLVIGARTSQRILVNTNDGDGTFTFESTTSSGGAVWMIACGDLNGDGHEDVTTANSSSNNGAILLGDGAGSLGAADTHPTDPFPIATDVGDLDGDGDLDWVTSSFSGDWFIFKNDGFGSFSFDQEILSPDAASCCLMTDLDNDGDLDLALVDENADVVILMENVGGPPVPVASGWGMIVMLLALLVVATVFLKHRGTWRLLQD